MLAIEYDVNPQGEIELVALINAVEEGDEDPDGEAWLAWRKMHEDGRSGRALSRVSSHGCQLSSWRSLRSLF